MSVTDIPGINTVVYPSYKINSTGPGVLIASYAVYDLSTTLAAMPEEEYVQYVLDAMAEMHGDVVREQYTGRYSRQCWNTARYTSGGWAEPTIGQQSLYMQSYFKTDKNVCYHLPRLRAIR
jgi:monoamine oxidase